MKAEMRNNPRQLRSTPFERLWGELRRSIMQGSMHEFEEAIDYARRVYRPAALRRRIRKLDAEALAFLPAQMWIDVVAYDESPARAYAVGLIRWELDLYDAALEAFAQSVELPIGQYAFADASLWMGHREQADSALRAIVEGGGEYAAPARVLLAVELGVESRQTPEIKKAAACAAELFGNGPSAEYFRRIGREWAVGRGQD